MELTNKLSLLWQVLTLWQPTHNSILSTIPLGKITCNNTSRFRAGDL